MAATASSQETTPRRRAVDSARFPGLWERRRADGSSVFEIKSRHNGRLVSETLVAGMAKTEAVAAWKKRAVQRSEGVALPPRHLRLEEVAREALADLGAQAAAGLRSQRTYELYLSRWDRFLAADAPEGCDLAFARIGRKPLAKLGAQDVLRLVADLREARLAEWTVHGIVVVLRFVLRFARHAGYMSGDPFATLRPEDLPQQRTRAGFQARVLRGDEVEKLLSKVSPSMRNLVTFVAFSGLRASEAIGAAWEDVSLLDATVTVREQLAPLKRGEQPQRTKLKSRASYRVVPLVPRAVEALEEQLQREQSAGRGRDVDFVFLSASGRPVSRHRLYDAIRRAGQAADLGAVGPQTLRRSMASASAHAGLAAVVGASITGHSREVYDKHYAKPFRDAQERELVRNALTSIGFGVAKVDQRLTSDARE